ncbi:26S proteasome non-ATPase regulatory subunit [Schizosaccharomyces cryophilus OY26]|uniref:26S proteasome non-ATPase regulatory subunit n=1 Tax=Schizosaccharomyces cryophilus (strain OY26 / ATCC MYA-4695 / CBS 11777 / NBRC 106824 / NRRL Y48691) TaxID=653667 RepID=S9X286_SCHCR|nr:26S proteasome non-ATPase regulatory subunit [Schizosaccharomyces cryophilus OY26]EPY51222.1 26S proteasome non-ATPase regulatory subunit [Schizosaccharomyces cryophilus OY26]
MEEIKLTPGLSEEGRRLLRLLKDIPLDPVEILEEIPNTLYAFRDSITAENRPACLGLLETLLGCFELPLPDEPIVKALEKLLEPMSWNDLKQFGIEAYLVTGLEQPSPEVQDFCLKLIRRANWQEKDVSENLFDLVLTCLNSQSIGVSEEAFQLLLDMSDYCFYFDQIVQEFTDMDYEILDTTLKVRWLLLFAKLAIKSPEYMNKLVKKGRLIFDIDENDDIFLRLCYVDVLSILLDTQFTFEYISSDNPKPLDQIIRCFQKETNSFTDHIGLTFLPILCQKFPGIYRAIDEQYDLFNIVRQRIFKKDSTSVLLYGHFLASEIITKLLIQKYEVESSEGYIPYPLLRMLLMDDTGFTALATALQQPNSGLWAKLWENLPGDSISSIMKASSSPLRRTRQLGYQCLLHIAQRSPIQIASRAFAIEYLLATDGDHETCVLRYEVLRTLWESSNEGNELPLGRYQDEIQRRLQRGVFPGPSSTLKIAAETA